MLNKTNPLSIKRLTSIVSSLLFLAIAACTGSESTPALTVTTETALDVIGSPSPTVVVTDLPTPTQAQNQVIFLTPEGSDQDLAVELEENLITLAEEDGLEYVRVNSLTPDEITGNVSIVVVIAPDPGVADLASTAQETQFLSIYIPEVESGINITTIGSEGTRPDQQGFIAGYLAATITPGWRVGVISTVENGSGTAARNAFLNGAVFFCGLCRPSTPPYVEYPQFVDVSSSSGQDGQQSAVNYMKDNGVNTVYVYPEVGGQTLFDSLADANIQIIGGESPSNSITQSWVATIQPDVLTPLDEVWPRLIAGSGGLSLAVPIVITDQNQNLFSIGRQRLVEETLIDLLDGYIDTGVNPYTGENQ